MKLVVDDVPGLVVPDGAGTVTDLDHVTWDGRPGTWTFGTLYIHTRPHSQCIPVQRVTPLIN